MDVKEGFCWRCNKKLHNKPFECKRCKLAEYCCQRCAEADRVRHESVECRLWSPRKCGCCHKSGVRKMCSGCFTKWYCSPECIRKDWKQHKPTCNMWQEIAIRATSKIRRPLIDLPYYFGNSFARDLLNLKGNEMKTSLDGNDNAPSQLNILLAASGDLKQVVKTVQSLPSEYKGTLRFVMNDIDPFVTARNVLMLFMMATSMETKASNIATIYLSLKLSKDDYSILQEALSALIQMDPIQLKEKTAGVVEFQEGLFDSLREVWAGWSNLPCLRNKSNCVNLDEQRKELFTTFQEESIRGSLKVVPKRHISSIKKWFKDGIILPSDMVKTSLPYFNPTFTGRSPDGFVSTTQTSPSSYTFGYCVATDCTAFQIWDYLDLIQQYASDSVTEMCHDFTTHCFKTNMLLMKESRVLFKIMTKDFVDLHGSHFKDFCEGFDRIYASNLIDYHGISEVIKTLEPFLSKQNPYSLLFTETYNWHCGFDGAVEPIDKLEMQTLFKRASVDLSLNSVYGLNCNVFHEYYDNTDFFMCIVRGSRLAESGKSCAKSNLPTWSELTTCCGLKMHDIRNGRNSVLPYRLRVNARSMNMLRGDVRTLEWSRIPATN